MMARYEKPTIEFEVYDLNTAVAAGCTTIVTLGPGDQDNPLVCAEYEPVLGLDDEASVMGAWYENSCSCYLSSGNGTLMTS